MIFLILSLIFLWFLNAARLMTANASFLEHWSFIALSSNSFTPNHSLHHLNFAFIGSAACVQLLV